MEGSKLPSLMGDFTDEELNALVVTHAKYFTVVQVRRGGFVGGSQNYERTQVATIEEARTTAAALYKEHKRPCIIYAVADFAGANGFSRPVENYPLTTYKTRADKIRDEKAARAAARAAKKSTKGTASKKPAAGPSKDFLDSDIPQVYVEP